MDQKPVLQPDLKRRLQNPRSHVPDLVLTHQNTTKNLHVSSVVKSYVSALLRGAAYLPQDNKSNIPKTS